MRDPHVQEPDSRYAPWTAEEVASIRAWQADERFHGLTCDRHSDDLLSVDQFGLNCDKCSYLQTWVPTALTRRPPPYDA